MKILVVEPKWSGHHLVFARAVADALTGDDEIVLSITSSTEPRPTRMREVITAEPDTGFTLRSTLAGPDEGYSKLNGTDGELESRSIEAEIVEVQPDLVVVPSADAVAFHLGGVATRDRFTQTVPSCFFLHAPSVGYSFPSRRAAAKKRLITHRLRKLDVRYGAFDHRIVNGLNHRRPVALLPDPQFRDDTPSVEDARARFALRPTQRVFLAAGEHADRKGTHQLVELWPRADELGGVDACLLIVGRCSEAVRAAVAARPDDLATGRIVVLDEVVETTTLRHAFIAADVVTACYPRHFGASGIVHTAADVSRPILGSDFGNIGDCIRNHGLGTTVDCTDPDVLRTAINDAIAEPPVLDEVRRQRFADFLDPANFRALMRSWVLDGDAATDPAWSRRPPLT